MVRSCRFTAMVVALALCAFAFPARAADSSWASAPQAFVVLRDGAPGGMRAFARSLEAAGGHVAVVYPPNAAVVFADAATLAAPSLEHDIALATREAVAQPDAVSPEPAARLAAQVWNASRELARTIALEPDMAATPGQHAPDAGPRPYTPGLEKPPLRAFVSDHQPYGADYYDTSEYMAGSVAVGVWLLEAPPASTYHWSTAHENLTLAGVQAGLTNWVGKGGPATFLTFYLDIHTKVPVSGTPIQNPMSMDQTWVNEFLGNAGWPGVNGFEKCYAYNNSIRDAFDTNWAYSMVIVESEGAVNQGLFSGGGYAWGYYGGPWLYMARFSTWAFNSANYFAAVPMHESGHIFFDTDEYDSVQQYNGYLNAPDELSLTQCIMNRNDTTRVCPRTRDQLGWRDLDGNGVIEPLDAPPVTALTPLSPQPTLDATPTWQGLASVATIPNLNPSSSYFPPHAITLATIDAVECRVDGGPWTPASPTDGAFDGYGDPFEWTSTPLTGGTHTVEARAHDSVGNWSTTYGADTFVVAATVGVGPTAGALRVFAPRPNPIHGPAEIPLLLAAPGEVDAEVLDPAGRRVRVLAAGLTLGAGANVLRWDGRDEAGRDVPAGVYVAWVRTGGQVRVQRIVVAR